MKKSLFSFQLVLIGVSFIGFGYAFYRIQMPIDVIFTIALSGISLLVLLTTTLEVLVKRIVKAIEESKK